MEKIEELIQRVRKIEHGFKGIEEEARDITEKNPVEGCLVISRKLFSSDVYQARSLATFVLGAIAQISQEALRFLREKVSKDQSWQVQEILAKAFDRYCTDTGYEQALPVIEEWMKDENPNVRRAVTEGLRIWTNREYFKENPGAAIRLLSQLKDDESEYVRKSVGNALRDISRKHGDLVESELRKWDTSDKRVKQTYGLASRFLA
ncbi:MAG: DNA alkylation repair protein [Promethearchaeati archaeon SRVP18_Atabeyarchaeia-1]